MPQKQNGLLTWYPQMQPSGHSVDSYLSDSLTVKDISCFSTHSSYTSDKLQILYFIYQKLTTSRRLLSCSSNRWRSLAALSLLEFCEPGDILPSAGDDLSSSTRCGGRGFCCSATAFL